ncbi:hypothetical protein ACQRC6_01920 [Peptoniphilus sp. SGI.035]|uniref:hypothetical protein n=1 Tax=Peptoniphilus sp. SGI.035 TaxID=3420564 RepID=UPI003CFF8377
MSYKILKNSKIKIMGDYNFNGKRYRPSKTIETDLDGIQLKALVATMLAYNNIPLANIAQRMGHLDTTTTLVYIHAVEEGKKEINNVLNKNINVDFLKVQ